MRGACKEQISLNKSFVRFEHALVTSAFITAATTDIAYDVWVIVVVNCWSARITEVRAAIVEMRQRMSANTRPMPDRRVYGSSRRRSANAARISVLGASEGSW